MKKLFSLFIFGLFFMSQSFATGIDAGVINADCDNATLGQYNGTADMEIDWQPNTIQISWYSDGTQLNVQSAAQTCFYGGYLVLPSTRPIKRGYTFEGWKVTVPTGYTELKYIESTGTQHIDLGQAIGTNENIISKFVYINNSTGEWFGASDGTDWRLPKFTFSFPTANPLIFMIYATANNNLVPHYYSASNPCIIGTEYTINWYGNPYKTATMSPDLGWSRTSHESYTPSLNAYLFKANYPNFSSSSVGRSMRIYYFSVEGKMNLIPARRKSDNVVGMWDTVMGTFFTNAGTGNFIAGPVVQ